MCDIFCGRGNPIGQVMTKVEAVKYAGGSYSIEQKRPHGVEGIERIEVVGDGSKVMKTVKLPTVFIRMPKGDVQKSRVYYVILEAESYEYGEIPALLFSKSSDGWRTQSAELLPLMCEYDLRKSKSVSLTPMLLRLRHKSMFSKGSCFKVKAIKSGRFDVSDSVSWSKWDLKLKAIRMMITEIIFQDIRKMPKDMIKRLIAPKASRCVSRSLSNSSETSSQNSSSQTSSTQTSSVPSSTQTSSVPSSSQRSQFRNLSTHYPNLKFKGLTASGGSSFAKWFRHLPPDIYVDKNFKCDRGTTLRKDRFADPETFFKYLTNQPY